MAISQLAYLPHAHHSTDPVIVRRGVPCQAIRLALLARPGRQSLEDLWSGVEMKNITRRVVHYYMLWIIIIDPVLL